MKASRKPPPVLAATAKSPEEPRVLKVKAGEYVRKLGGGGEGTWLPHPRGVCNPWSQLEVVVLDLRLLSPTLSLQRGLTGARNVSPGHPAQFCSDPEHWL